MANDEQRKVLEYYVVSSGKFKTHDLFIAEICELIQGGDWQPHYGLVSHKDNLYQVLVRYR